MASSPSSQELSPKQPIHPSLLDKLDPEYIEFHNKHILYITPPNTLPWDPAIRNAPSVPGGSEPLEVGKTEDFSITYTKIRTFTPEGSPPEGGWPVFIFFHGGGWTLGNINSETSFSTNMCVGANCVVVSVDYRLAPEDPYPSAVEDAVDALEWVAKNGPQLLNINAKRIAIGGSSSGGNLAAILAIEAKYHNPPIPLVFQLLIVPVTDNTASVDNYWAETQHAPWLSPARMMWFRRHYLPYETAWTKWDASPIFASTEMMRDLPKAWIAVAELDILCAEGIAYGEKLKAAGVAVQVQIYKGAPHPIMAMDGDVLKIGRQLVSDAASALKNAFSSSY